MDIIRIEHLTKDYGGGKGIFDISIEIPQGEIYGYLGPNGAGKSTTMRSLMGFAKPQSGSVQICGLDCFTEQKKIQPSLGYLPGEIALPDDMTGIQYLKLIMEMRGEKDFSYGKKLLERFKLDADTGMKRMSKGMKQKIGIVAAFMHNPEVLLLDEPTSGLDPLMQNTFIQLLEEERERGKTILLSSHVFEEVERTCDRVGMIRGGKLIQEFTVDQLRHSQGKTYKIELKNSSDIEVLKRAYPKAEVSLEKRQMVISVNDTEINQFIAQLGNCSLTYLREEKHTLEEYFMGFYGGEEDNDKHPLF